MKAFPKPFSLRKLVVYNQLLLVFLFFAMIIRIGSFTSLLGSERIFQVYLTAIPVFLLVSCIFAFNFLKIRKINREYARFLAIAHDSGLSGEMIDKDAFSIAELQTIISSLNAMIGSRNTGEAALKRGEAELQKERDRAEAANRAKSDFLASMSHEIRTPMNAILGFSDLLDFLIEDKKQKKYIDAIRTSGKSLLNLINDILDLSKIEAGRLEMKVSETDFRDLVKEMQVMFQPGTAQKGLSFEMSVSPSVPGLLLLDEGRMRQVMVNLIGNAVKFTERGYVRIEADYFPDSGSERDGILVLAVRDSGIGIPKEHLDKLFNAFTQIDSALTKKYQGTGLGLSIVKKLVELMDGSVECNSVEGEGSYFRLSIPSGSAGSPVRVEEKPDRLMDFSFRKGKVLVVDDIEPNRDLVVELLSNTVLETFTASDGPEALEKFESLRPDVILLDIRMPGMDGFEVKNRIRAMPGNESTAIIALTAQALKQDEETILASGFSGYIRKPVTVHALYDELARFLPWSGGNREVPRSAGSAGDPEADGAVGFSGLDRLRTLCLSSGRVRDYELFGKACAETGLRLHLRELVEFGETVLDLAASFDAYSLKRAVDAFSPLGLSAKKEAK